MRAVMRWIARFGDELVALVLALAVVGLAWADVVGSAAVANTVLLVLAAITTANLRDRFRARAAHEELLQQLEQRAGELASSLTSGTHVRVLTGTQIATEHAVARKGTVLWHFRGGTGTYLRAVTLPECITAARSNRRRLEVRIQILDPANEELCGRYARFRTTLAIRPDGVGEPWTLDRTRKEAYATILAACWHRQRYDLLDIAVGLSNTMTTFRWDQSSTAVILTQENPDGQALLFARDKPYYGYWDVELRSSFDQSRHVPIENDVPLSDEPSVDEVTALFAALGMPLPYSGRDVSDIVFKALRARNPYKR
ncbi:MAG TPA: hypothetical protein VGS97_17125 [Actinocrinis sp.]|uniref:hypothetical protein n=1 Tax=Actinocrinis sp. TaxID=1920516 RepID=UPI002DDCB288|nr:hypothetical protein [Actinocrinis sp.]HEV2345824.1 hypothetical protein [Actinocrinis sp.]